MATYKLVVNENEGVLICGNSTRVVRIKLMDINYVSCSNRIITIHTDNYDEDFYARISDIYNALKELGFEYINESEIVNVSKIWKMSTNSIFLQENTELICSKQYKPKIKEIMWKN